MKITYAFLDPDLGWVTDQDVLPPGTSDYVTTHWYTADEFVGLLLFKE